MASKKKKGNGFGKGTFVDTRMFLSEAFLSLGQSGTSPIVSTVSMQVLMMFLGKRQFTEIKNRKGQRIMERTDDNRFTLSYKELLSYGYRLDKSGTRVKGVMTQPRATRAIDELLAKGFIEIVEYGGCFEKHKTVYGLVDDWQGWHVGDPPIRTRQQDRRRGFQGKLLGAVKSNTAHTGVAHPHTHRRCTLPG